MSVQSDAGHDVDSLLSALPAVSHGELAEHLGYLTDLVKLDAYRAALREVVRAESVVLDLGAGTGLLGLLAAQCGARRVYAVDGGPILRLAADVAARSGLADRIVHIGALSTTTSLPEPVDVIVCDQIGGFVHDAGVLRYYADAAQRFLRPGGVLVPSEFTVSLTPVADPELAAIVADWDKTPAGFDLSPFSEAAANTEHYVNAASTSALGPDGIIAKLGAAEETHFGGEVDLSIERPGELCGLLGTFVARMSPGVTLTNAPWADGPMRRWQNFYPIAKAIDVVPGDRVLGSIDVSPRTGMVAWKVSVVRADGSEGPSFAHDTLRGTFAGPDAVIRASDVWVPPVTARTELARVALELVDGGRSVAEIALRLREAHPDELVSDVHARSFVRSVVGPTVDR